ncbi:hypothetical protein MKX03_027091, partial [Papaver bracteatum]
MAPRALLRRKRLLVDYLNRPAYSVEAVSNSGYGESSQFLSLRSLNLGLYNSSTHINHEDSRPGLLGDKNELLTSSTTHFFKHSSLEDATTWGTLLSQGIRCMSQPLCIASTTKVGQGRSEGFVNMTGLSNRREKLRNAILRIK